MRKTINSALDANRIQPMTSRQLKVYKLANSLIEVYDYSARWRTVYNADGSYRHSGCDCREYRAAVRAFIANTAARFQLGSA